MEKNPKKLLELVEEQQKQIGLYQNKLRDTVQAYKSVVKEKEALESTIKTLKTDVVSSEDPENGNETENHEKCSELKQKMVTLLESITTLTDEKSRMELNFRSDKKKLKEEKESFENKCHILEQQLNKLQQEVEELKSKQSIEENDIVNNDLRLPQIERYEKTVMSLTNELEVTKKQLEVSEKKLNEAPLELMKLQDEMRNLQTDHLTAIQMEKERVKSVEERAKKLSALHEERVVNLEAQVVELSQTVGSYDRLRIQDQMEIQKLKQHIAMGNIEQSVSVTHDAEAEKCDNFNSDDVDNIIEKILDLKVKLSNAAENSGKPVDFSKLFSDSSIDANIHASCVESYNKLKKEFELFKNDVKLCGSQEKSGKEVVFLQNQVKNLQERLRIVNEKNLEMEKDYQLQIDQLKNSMKNEKARLKEAMSAMESDYRGRLWLLEEQLQKQRERSLALLEEKEQEIQSLQNTFNVFMPGYRRKSEDESNFLGLAVNQVRDGPHILHYANELARRDIEIANLRKSKHKTETALRDLKKMVATDAEKHRDERQALRDEIGRLKLCQSREGANLEYLKNVVLSFLLSNDAQSKRHMCNAIAAVLKFSDSELARVTRHSRNTWWNHSSYL